MESLRILLGEWKEVSLPGKLWDWLFWNWVSPGQGVRTSSFSLTSLPSSLVNLSLEYCNLSENAIPSDLSSLGSLKYLDLSGNPIRGLPESIKGLTMLQRLDLYECTSLKSLPALPTSLEELMVGDCTSLERMKNLPNLMTELYIEGCEKLVEIQGLFKLEPVENIEEEIINNMGLLGSELHDGIDLLMVSNLTATTWDCSPQVLYECGIFSIFLPGCEVPHCFSFKTLESEMSFRVPLLPNLKIRALNICVVYGFLEDGDGCFCEREIKVNNLTKGYLWKYKPILYAVPIDNEDIRWFSYWNIGEHFDAGDDVIVSVVQCDHRLLRKFGISFDYKQEEKGTQFNSQEEEVGQNSVDGNVSEDEVRKLFSPDGEVSLLLTPVFVRYFFSGYPLWVKFLQDGEVPRYCQKPVQGSRKRKAQP